MFKATSRKYERSFLGSYLFEKLVPENHPLRLLSQIADFSQMDEDLKHLYSERGQRAHSPSMMIRILILKDLYNISDEKVIQMIKENIPGKTKDEKHNDPDAKFAHKSPTKTFFGYKHHTAVENKHNVIITVQTTPGDIYDGHKMKEVIDESLEKIAPPEIIAADKGYDDIENHEYVESRDIFSAIALKETRLQTKNKEFKYYDASGRDNRFFQQYLDPRYEQGQKQRYKVEQPYAEMKNYQGLRRSKYLGLEKNRIQGLMTAGVYNLKHILTFVKNNISSRKLNRAFVT